jgi:hypothetical protein
MVLDSQDGYSAGPRKVRTNVYYHSFMGRADGGALLEGALECSPESRARASRTIRRLLRARQAAIVGAECELTEPDV